MPADDTAQLYGRAFVKSSWAQATAASVLVCRPPPPLSIPTATTARHYRSPGQGAVASSCPVPNVGGMSPAISSASESNDANRPRQTKAQVRAHHINIVYPVHSHPPGAAGIFHASMSLRHMSFPPLT